MQSLTDGFTLVNNVINLSGVGPYIKFLWFLMCAQVLYKFLYSLFAQQNINPDLTPQRVDEMINQLVDEDDVFIDDDEPIISVFSKCKYCGAPRTTSQCTYCKQVSA